LAFGEYTIKPIEQVFAELGSSYAGLSKKEVLSRREENGLNEIKSRGISALQVLTRQLKSPFFYLLFAAALISFFVGQKTDFFIITAAVLVNAAISFLQEYRAERAIFFLR